MTTSIETAPGAPLSAAQAAYLAGVLDMKGRLEWRRRRGRPTPILRVTSGDRPQLLQLREELCRGDVDTNRQTGSHRLSIEGTAPVRGVLALAAPYMRVRGPEWLASLDAEPSVVDPPSAVVDCLVCGQPVRARGLCSTHYRAARHRQMFASLSASGCAVCGRQPAEDVDPAHLPRAARAAASSASYLCSACHRTLSKVRRRAPSSMGPAADAPAASR